MQRCIGGRLESPATQTEPLPAFNAQFAHASPSLHVCVQFYIDVIA